MATENGLTTAELIGNAYLTVGISQLVVREALTLAESAKTDKDTNLLNNPAFTEAVEQKIAEGRPFILLLTDFTGFKLLNDSFGHQTGNRFIKNYSELLQHLFRRSSDKVLGRVGGDEMAAAFGDFRPHDVKNQHPDKDKLAAFLKYFRKNNENFLKNYPDDRIADLAASGRLQVAYGASIWYPDINPTDLYETADHKLRELQVRQKQFANAKILEQFTPDQIEAIRKAQQILDESEVPINIGGLLLQAPRPHEAVNAKGPSSE